MLAGSDRIALSQNPGSRFELPGDRQQGFAERGHQMREKTALDSVQIFDLFDGHLAESDLRFH